MAFCGKCGAQNPDGNKFCAACGAELISIQAPLQDSEPVQVQPAPQPQVYAQVPVQGAPSVKEKPKRSFLWTFVAIIAIVMTIVSWNVEGIPLTIFLVVTSFILAVIALVKKVRLRAIAVIAVIVTGGLLILWIIQGIIDLTGGDYSSKKTVESGDIQYTIPGYFKSDDSSNPDMLVYAFSKGNSEGGYLDFIYSNMYNDGGETAAAIASNQNLIRENQTKVDTYIDKMLLEGIDAGIKNMNGKDKTFVKDVQIAGFPGKEFSFTVNQDGYDFNGLVAASFDINTGGLYAVLMVETVNSTKNRLADFDGIIESATLKTGAGSTTGAGNSNKSTSGSGTINNSADTSKPSTATGGVDPDLKAALDEYEAFMDEYCDFMKKYSSDPNASLSMLTDYTEMLTKYADFTEKINGLDTSNMSKEDYAYYLDVINRVEKKLLDVM